MCGFPSLGATMVPINECHYTPRKKPISPRSELQLRMCELRSLQKLYGNTDWFWFCPGSTAEQKKWVLTAQLLCYDFRWMWIHGSEFMCEDDVFAPFFSSRLQSNKWRYNRQTNDLRLPLRMWRCSLRAVPVPLDRQPDLFGKLSKMA